MPEVEVIGGNLHNEAAAAHWLRRRSRADAPGHFDLLFYAEGQKRRARRILNRAPGHRLHTGPRGKGSNDAARETGILIADHLPDLGGGSYHLSDEAKRFKSVGKERWGQVAVTEIAGRGVDLICGHPVAGPAALSGDDPDHPLVKRYAEATRWLDGTLANAAARGHEVIGYLDAQMFHSWDQPWSPIHTLRAHGLRWYWHRIDVVFWSAGFHRSRTSLHDIGSDHPALRVALDVRPRQEDQR